MRSKRKTRQREDFIAPARRAFHHVARRLRAENARLGLPIIAGENRKVRMVKVSATRPSLSAEAGAKAEAR